MNELHLAWGNFISFNHQLTCPRRDTVLHCCDDGCTLIQLKRIFQYQLRQHAETRSSICNIPVTERYGYVGRAEEKQEEKVRFDRFIQYVQSKIIREEKKLQSIYNSLGLLWLSFFLHSINSTEENHIKCLLRLARETRIHPHWIMQAVLSWQCLL